VEQMRASQRLDPHLRVSGTVMLEDHVAWIDGTRASLCFPDLDSVSTHRDRPPSCGAITLRQGQLGTRCCKKASSLAG
jgi:hypothetical protein